MVNLHLFVYLTNIYQFLNQTQVVQSVDAATEPAADCLRSDVSMMIWVYIRGRFTRFCNDVAADKFANCDEMKLHIC
jgi:hypothetical protein